MGFVDTNYPVTVDTWNVPNKYYTISRIVGWEHDNSSDGFSGFTVTWSPPSSWTGWPDETHTFGVNDPSLTHNDDKTITSNLLSARICVDQNWNAS